jgi:hypothetical protein
VRFIEETTLQDEATAAIIRLNALSADIVLGNVTLEVDARTALVVPMRGRSKLLAIPQFGTNSSSISRVTTGSARYS